MPKDNSTKVDVPSVMTAAAPVKATKAKEESKTSKVTKIGGGKMKDLKKKAEKKQAKKDKKSDASKVTASGAKTSDAKKPAAECKGAKKAKKGAKA